MAKPNRVFANMPKRSPVEEVRCTSMSHAEEVAIQKRAAGFDAKATSRKVGARRPPRGYVGFWKPAREFTCFVYKKMGS